MIIISRKFGASVWTLGKVREYFNKELGHKRTVFRILFKYLMRLKGTPEQQNIQHSTLLESVGNQHRFQERYIKERTKMFSLLRRWSRI